MDKHFDGRGIADGDGRRQSLRALTAWINAHGSAIVSGALPPTCALLAFAAMLDGGGASLSTQGMEGAGL